jgi:hypothetical protein
VSRSHKRQFFDGAIEWIDPQMRTAQVRLYLTQEIVEVYLARSVPQATVEALETDARAKRFAGVWDWERRIYVVSNVTEIG